MVNQSKENIPQLLFLNLSIKTLIEASLTRDKMEEEDFYFEGMIIRYQSKGGEVRKMGMVKKEDILGCFSGEETIICCECCDDCGDVKKLKRKEKKDGNKRRVKSKSERNEGKI
jgi:hypothetical protein